MKHKQKITAAGNLHRVEVDGDIFNIFWKEIYKAIIVIQVNFIDTICVDIMNIEQNKYEHWKLSSQADGKVY